MIYKLLFKKKKNLVPQIKVLTNLERYIVQSIIPSELSEMTEEQAIMEHNAFAKKPFYKWFTRKCSECEKRSVWSPMMKCKCCKTYNHRKCKEKHAQRMEATARQVLVANFAVDRLRLKCI